MFWTERGALHFTYSVTGDIGDIRIPPPRSPRQANDLWRHTCFEAFVALKGASAYREFNFAPSGEWAVYGFRRYRDREPLVIDGSAPTLTVLGLADSFKIDAIVPVDLLPSLQPSARFSLGLSAVIEETDGACSYWALRHPPGKPNFHHADGFALEIEAPTL